MASILTSLGIAEIRGSVGGMTFSKNHYGAYVRNRSIPVNPNTALQVAVRATLAFLTNRWSADLTPVQRFAWNLYGSSVAMLNRLGQTIYLTGFNHYIRSNTILQLTAQTLVDNGPVIFELPAQDPTMLVTGSEATQQLTVSYNASMNWNDETGGFLWVFQGKPQNPQRNFFGGPWRYIDNVPGADGVPVASPLVAGVNFAISETQRQWIYARIQRADGRLSEPFRADAFTGA